MTGRSSIPETPVLEPRSRGVLDAPPSRGMTAEGRRDSAVSRHEMSELFKRTTLEIKRAQGMPDARCTGGRVCSKKHTRSNHRYTASAGIPCAMVLTVSFVLSSVTMLGCHRRLRNRFRKLSASVGAPEPHDFTVRLLRHSSDDVPRPSHPAPNVRDDREPPLLWVRDKREHRFDLPDNAIPGTCDRLARRASHHLACSHPRVSQLSSVAGCGSAAFPSPQCPQLR